MWTEFVLLIHWERCAVLIPAFLQAANLLGLQCLDLIWSTLRTAHPGHHAASTLPSAPSAQKALPLPDHTWRNSHPGNANHEQKTSYSRHCCRISMLLINRIRFLLSNSWMKTVFLHITFNALVAEQHLLQQVVTDELRLLCHFVRDKDLLRRIVWLIKPTMHLVARKSHCACSGVSWPV